MTTDMADGGEPKLTLLCPIKDRPDYTKRFVAYLVKEGCPFPVIIADGSATDEIRDIAETAISHGLNLEYRKYAFDENWGCFLDKMCQALGHIKTPYASLVSDDDFYDFYEMARGVRFLEKNPKYRALATEIIDFHVAGRGGVYGDIELSEGGRHCSGRFKRDQQVDDENLAERLKRYDDVFPYEYIHHTETLRDIFELAKVSKVRSYMHLQPILKYVTLICGPVYYFGTPFVLRQDNTATAEGKEMAKEAATPLHFHARQENARTEAEIIDRLVKYVTERESGVSRAEIEVILQSNLAARYQQAISQNLHFVVNADRLPVKYLLSLLWRRIVFSLRTALVATYVGQILRKLLVKIEQRDVRGGPMHFDFLSDHFLNKVISAVSRRG